MRNTRDITIYDIAKALNVSAATVSRGLKNHPSISKETKRKIVEVARHMGYQQNVFASNLRKKRTNTIGVVVPRLNSYFMSAVISGMEKVANQAGYNLIISQSLESVNKEMANVQTMFNSRVDGLLISLASNTENIEHLEFMLQKGIPLIFFDRIFNHPDCTSIVIDNCQAGYEITHHLLQQGCRRIMHITHDLRSNVYADRLRGYQKALAEYQLAYDPALLLTNNLSDQDGIEAARTIMAMPELPDGIFVANDTCAVSCMSALEEMGVQVPQEIALAGFNNDAVSKVVRPKLTTIHYPGQQMGEVAVSTLVGMLSNSPTANLNRIVLRHELIVRQSSLKKGL